MTDYGDEYTKQYMPTEEYECLHCGLIDSRPEHWETCGRHPARVRLELLERELEMLRQDRDKLLQLFDLQHRRVVASVEAWREENPGKELVMPALNDHITWMIERYERAERELEMLREALLAAWDEAGERSYWRQSVIEQVERALAGSTNDA